MQLVFEAFAVFIGALRDVLDFILVVLAAWRITSLLVREDGPFDVFADLRRIAGVKYDERSAAYSDTFFGKLLSCTWCLSIWIGLVASIFAPYSVNVSMYLLDALAISTLIIWIDKQVI